MKTHFFCCAVVFAVVSFLVVSCAAETESAGCVGRSQDRGSKAMEVISGFANITPSGSSAELDWVYLVPEVVDLPGWPYYSPKSSSLMLVLRDSSGTVVRTVQNPLLSGMSVSYEYGPPPGDFEVFAFQVVDPPRYDSLTVQWQGMELPTEPSERSAHAPTVTISGICSGRFFAGEGMIDFFLTVEDRDNDELEYIVYYSVDAGETYHLYEPNNRRVADTTSDMFSVDASRIPATDQARIGVSVSDGTRSAFAETPIFIVGQGIPTVSIQEPEPGQIVMYSNFELAARASDKEDGRLPSSAYSWRSNVDGHLGDGSSIIVDASKLTPGDHTISATVTDSTGRTAADTVSITRTTTDEPPPEAVDDTFSILPIGEDEMFSGDRYGRGMSLDVLANDANIDPRTLRITNHPTLGTVHRYWQDPYAGHRVIKYVGRTIGQDSLTYQICDNFGRCDTATATIHITNPN